MRRLRFKKNDIQILRDPSYFELKIAIDQAAADIYLSYKNEGLNTLFFVYYSGHGMMSSTTLCVLNDRRLYPIEKMVRSMAKQGGAYIMTVLDCCRELIKDE